jgi:hypothetical protein
VTEQIGVALPFSAHYIESKVGKTGLVVTVDVYRNGVEIVTGAAATEAGDGLYTYTLPSGDNNAEGVYVAVFKTATSTVDQREIPALWLVQKGGVENLNATISSRAPETDTDALIASLTTAAADIATLVARLTAPRATNLDNLDAAVSTRATPAQTADAVLDEVVTGHSVVGSVGARLALIGAGAVQVAAPVESEGTLRLVRGDDYYLADGNPIRFVEPAPDAWADLTGATVKLTIGQASAITGVIVEAVTYPKEIYFEVGSAVTSLLEARTTRYDVEATLANTHQRTLAKGVAIIEADQGT